MLLLDRRSRKKPRERHDDPSAPLEQAHWINGHETIEQNEDGRRFRGEFTHSTFGRMQARLQR